VERGPSWRSLTGPPVLVPAAKPQFSGSQIDDRAIVAARDN